VINIGIWTEKWEQYKAGVDLDGISTFRKMFFKTNPTDDQILYLDIIAARNAGGWAVLIAMMFLLGIGLGFFGNYAFTHFPCGI
jgi:hypothetical protein